MRRQLTIQGILLTVCFLGLANAKVWARARAASGHGSHDRTDPPTPLTCRPAAAPPVVQPAENLSKQRPQANIFNLYIVLSVMGQFAVHVLALMQVSALAKSFMPAYELCTRVRTMLPHVC